MSGWAGSVRPILKNSVVDAVYLQYEGLLSGIKAINYIFEGYRYEPAYYTIPRQIQKGQPR